ncbi:MAG: glycosyl transferase [Kyrpidia sp.]|nr:glycosyl transferase [Kyrpidia sp.]
MNDSLVVGMRLDHMERMTDSTGMIQHAVGAVPDFATGYTTDDNARALIVALGLQSLPDCTSWWARLGKLADRYLAFLVYAQRSDGRFRNFVGYDRRFLEDVGSEDSLGRALWALGEVVSSHPDSYYGRVAAAVFERAAPHAADLSFVRAQAFALLGLCAAWEGETVGVGLEPLIEGLVGRLTAAYRLHAGPGWRWFDEALTYSNGVVPAALLRGAIATGSEEARRIAVDALDFLTESLIVNGQLEIVGNAGWYPKGGRRALYDQQPVDAGAMVLAYTTFWRLLGRPQDREAARISFAWFTGRNIEGIPLYDPDTGGCRDGLLRGGVNVNQGAESVIAYLLSCYWLLKTGLARASLPEEEVRAAG